MRSLNWPRIIGYALGLAFSLAAWLWVYVALHH